jgi:hypothetical protein
MESILAGNARLLDPELLSEEASAIARRIPAIAWLTYGVHGDEAASTEAALWTAWDLATDGQGATGILDSLVVVIDPVANPDGRARYVQWYRGVRAIPPNEEPASREHSPPWPGGRYNHYLFDLNRDWTWATQVETRSRLLHWARWNPHIHIDFHEMGFNSTYFFFPAAEPLNPIYPDYTVRWGEYFGRANATEFDRRRWLYYTGETFDMFYPGFGDTWPSLVGAIGMTYEQAGSGRAGLAVRREDGTLLTLRDRAMHHRVAGLTTLRAAAARRTELLTEFAGFHRSQGDGQPDILLVPGPDASIILALVEALQAQGVRVERATRSFRVDAEPHPGFERREDFPVGTFRVPARQPRGRLATTLLQPDTRLSGAEQTYDVTAWSMPYAYGVEAHSSPSAANGDFAIVPAVRQAEEPANREDPYGWLVSPSYSAAGPLVRYVSAGGRAYALRGEFEQGGVSWPPGTVFLPGDPGAADRLQAAGLYSEARPVSSGRVAGGRDLGTGASLTVRVPRIAVLAGAGLRATSVGAVWYALEIRAGIPFDALDTGRVSPAVLSEYDVVVLPSGSPSRALGEGEEALAEWVRSGGTLISLGSSSRWAGSVLAEVETRSTSEDDVSLDERRRKALRTLQERRSDSWDDAVTGIILPLSVDPEHPLAWGSGRGNEAGKTFALHIEDLAFEPAPGLETVAAFADSVGVVSGAVSREKLDQIAASSWLSVAPVGRGKVILFADDPLFRLMWPANLVMFSNALLYGPLLR